MTKTIIETKKISKAFKKEQVLKDISIKVRKGTVYGLLGANGVGKSTFLKIITGILKADSGEIYFDGKLWERDQLLRIGSMIEGPAIYENLSAYDNLKVLILQLNLPEQRINEVLKLVNLTGTGKKKSGQFSLGMKQRLGIAMALINHPKLLILDEPTNGLDPLGIRELRELIHELTERGVSVLLSSHILSEVQLIADDIGILHDGVIGFEGPNDQEKHDLEQIFMSIVSGVAYCDKREAKTDVSGN